MKSCPFCAEEIQDEAKFCRFCGRNLATGQLLTSPPTAPSQKRPSPPLKPWRRWIAASPWRRLVAAVLFAVLAMLAVAVMVVVGVGLQTMRQDAGGVATGEPSERISAAALFAEYEANEVAADARYRMAVLEVEGLVKDIGIGAGGTPYLILGENLDSPFGVQALFSRVGGQALASLRKGQRVAVICRGSRGKVVNVILQSCELR